MNTEEKIISTVTWIKANAYAKGFREAHSRYCVLAAVVPNCVSKAELIRMIKLAAKAAQTKLEQLEDALKQYDH